MAYFDYRHKTINYFPINQYNIPKKNCFFNKKNTSGTKKSKPVPNFGKQTHRKKQ